VCVQSELEHLSALVSEVDGLQYSCHASAILDTEAPTDQMAALRVSNNKVCVPNVVNGQVAIIYYLIDKMTIEAVFFMFN